LTRAAHRFDHAIDGRIAELADQRVRVLEDAIGTECGGGLPLVGCRAVMLTWLAPAARAVRMLIRPIVPAPRTATRSPLVTRPRRAPRTPNGERLDEGARCYRHSFGKRVDRVGRDGGQLGATAAAADAEEDSFHASFGCPERHGPHSPQTTRGSTATGVRDGQRHSRSGDVDDAADLVTRLQAGWRRKPAAVKMQVRAADAHGRDAEPDPAGLRVGRLPFDDVETSLVVPDGSFHTHLRVRLASLHAKPVGGICAAWRLARWRRTSC
jgi:hypothetical protein